ncbi:MAG: alpha/beta hydrolase [Methanoregula sp.]|jgi:pimeloyl-ACP methyl ester carboxylesterase
MSDGNETFIGILAADYPVCIYDHRDMENSSDTNTVSPIGQYADDAAGLMQALGHTSMNVYSVSMGSSISQQLVLDHPERVDKLIRDLSSCDVRLPENWKLLDVIQSAAGDSSLPQGLRNEALANLVWNGSCDNLSTINKDVMLVVGTSDELARIRFLSKWPEKSKAHDLSGSRGCRMLVHIMHRSSTGIRLLHSWEPMNPRHKTGIFSLFFVAFAGTGSLMTRTVSV